MCPYHSVSAAGNLQRGPAPLSGIVLSEPRWFPTGTIPLSKMCLMAFPLLSVAVRRAPIAMHSHPHSCFQHVTSHSWRVAWPLCSENVIFCIGVPPLQRATHDAEYDRRWGRKKLLVLRVLHSNGQIFNPGDL